MELDRVAAGLYYRSEVKHLHATENKYRPRTIGKSSTVTEAYLPLLQASLNVNVVNTTSRTILTHLFSNDGNEVIPEATYSFPLYDGSTVISFTCWIGGVTVIGSVEAKKKAQEKYQGAVSCNDVPVLLEEHTSEIFETSVGNIPGQTDVRIEIVYVSELKPDIGGEGVLVTIPTSVAPRYGTLPHGYSKKADSSLEVKDGMEIRVEVSTSVPIRKLESRTHPISVDLGSATQPVQIGTFGGLAAGATSAVAGNRRARATLSNHTPVLGRDFVLLILVSEPGLLAPRAVIESCAGHPGYSAVQVAFTPRDLFVSRLTQDSFKAEIIFVADRSGSMENKISALRRSFGIFLQSIPQKGFHFNIASFGSTCSLLWPRSKQYDQETLTAAHQHLKSSFKADMGGTELLQALKTVVSSRRTNIDLPTEILLLTDGEVWDVDAILDFVRSTRDEIGEKVRFFALGIGNAVSHKLLEGIGCFGGGFAEVVAVDSPGSWDERVVRMLKGALSPSYWNCRITLKSDQEQLFAMGSSPKKSHPDGPRLLFVKAPYEIPPLLSFTQSISYFLIESPDISCTSITIHGASSSGQNVTVDIPIERAKVSDPTILHLAAKAILSDMETGRSQLHDEAAQRLKLSASAIDAYICKKAEAIGKKWSITGRWTSFVGVSSSNQGKHYTRIYRANKVELAGLTETRGNYRWGNDAINNADGSEDQDSTDSEDGSGDDESMPDRGRSEEDDDGDTGNGRRDGGGAGGGSWTAPDGNGRTGGEGGGRGQVPGSQSGEGDSGRGSGGFGDIQGSSTLSKEGEISQQRRQWFQPGSGISREVAMVEIARYLGPRATVRTGTCDGVEGYWITGICEPGVQIEQILKLQTEKWTEEIKDRGNQVAYLLSETYRVNQTDGLQDAVASPHILFSGTLSSSLKSSVGSIPSVVQPSPQFHSILNCYEHSGAFHDSPEATLIFCELLGKFKSGVLPLMQKELQKSLNQVKNIEDKICKTIILVTYLRKGYPHRTGAWELVVMKAEKWISSIVHSHSVVQELERTAAANWIGTEIYDDEQLDPEGGVSPGAPNSGCYPSSVPKYNSSASPSNPGASRTSNLGVYTPYFDSTQGYSMEDPYGHQLSSSYQPGLNPALESPPTKTPKTEEGCTKKDFSHSMSTQQWFQPGEGIAREVITADIQRYLGPDALVRPGEGTGEYEGLEGYWLTAYRTLTSQMVQDLRSDSRRWQAEVQQGRVAYQDSNTHRSRQYYGPSAPTLPHAESTQAQSAYSYPQPSYTYVQPSYTNVQSSYTNMQPSSEPGYYSPQPRSPYSYAESSSELRYPAQGQPTQGQGQGQLRSTYSYAQPSSELGYYSSQPYSYPAQGQPTQEQPTQGQPTGMQPANKETLNQPASSDNTVK